MVQLLNLSPLTHLSTYFDSPSIKSFIRLQSINLKSCQSRFRNVTSSEFSNFQSRHFKINGRKENETTVKATSKTFTEEKRSVITYKHILLLIMDHNPYLCETSRQTVSTATAMARQYNSDITVVVIDEKERDKVEDHDLKIKNIKWHLAEGGFEDFKLVERFGEGKKPAAILGEVADDLNLDLVIFSMNLIHNKYIDANLLVEFVPCPVLLLPM